MAKKFQIVTRSAPFLSEPDLQAPLTSEGLYGEIVETLSHSGDFLMAKNLTDGYEGFIPKDALSDEIIEPTHKIIRIHSLVYAEPDYKTQPITHLSFLSGLALSGEKEDGFAEVEGGGWIWEDDIAPLAHHGSSLVKTAEMFLGLPYLWGGKTGRGLDCSGLVQLCLNHAGITAPRDTKDQVKAKIGERVEPADTYTPDNLQSGDLVFFKGHVGIMVDSDNILNATARSMDVRIESLKEMSAHYEGGITAIKRL